MIAFRIDGRTVKLPTQWSEVVYKDFIELALLGNDLVGQMAYLMGMTKKEFESGTFDEGLDAVFIATAFLARPIEIHDTPQYIGSYKPGTEIRTMAQLNAITEQCTASAQTADKRLSLESMAMIAAIQCQGLTEPFDTEKAKYLCAQFMNMPGLQVYETGTYFHAKAIATVYRKDLNQMLRFVRVGVKIISGEPSFFKRMKTRWRSR